MKAAGGGLTYFLSIDGAKLVPLSPATRAFSKSRHPCREVSITTCATSLSMRPHHDLRFSLFLKIAKNGARVHAELFSRSCSIASITFKRLCNVFVSETFNRISEGNYLFVVFER